MGRSQICSVVDSITPDLDRARRSVGGRTVFQKSPDLVDVSCRRCGSPLHLVSDAVPLVFSCDNAHLLRWRDLLEVDFPGSGPMPLLRTWEQEARMLHELSGCALHHGRALVAADFKEAALRIEGWISMLPLLQSPAA